MATPTAAPSQTATGPSRLLNAVFDGIELGEATNARLARELVSLAWDKRAAGLPLDLARECGKRLDPARLGMISRTLSGCIAELMDVWAEMRLGDRGESVVSEVLARLYGMDEAE